jgi:osmotically-inducible protein OsmY
MKYVYKLAFILVIGTGFALAQTGARPSSQSQAPDTSQVGQSGSSSAAASTKAQSDIQSALRKQLPASADNVTVSVTDDNKVQLSGSVASDSEKQQVEQIARSAAPNVDIVNKLSVSGSSSGPGSTSPSGSQPPSSEKPPMRLVAYQQQSGSASQDPSSQQNPSQGAGASAGASQTSPTSSSNASDVQDKIQKAIQQDSSLASSNITVNVTGNNVELTGTVASKDQKKTAYQIAESNASGMKVVNHLKVSSSQSSPSTPKY